MSQRISLFSPPLSLRTLDERLYYSTAFVNKDADKYTGSLKNPSMPPCTAILHLKFVGNNHYISKKRKIYMSVLITPNKGMKL